MSQTQLTSYLPYLLTYLLIPSAQLPLPSGLCVAAHWETCDEDLHISVQRPALRHHEIRPCDGEHGELIVGDEVRIEVRGLSQRHCQGIL